MIALPPIRRRWFRFSLRTLFVALSVIAVWLGGELKFIRDRKQGAERLNRDLTEGGYATTYPLFITGPEYFPRWLDEYTDERTIPIWREWLGDRPYGLICVPAQWPVDIVTRYESLFPEAFVYWEKDHLQATLEWFKRDSRENDWVDVVERLSQSKVPPEDVSKVQSVDEALHYAQQHNQRTSTPDAMQ